MRVDEIARHLNATWEGLAEGAGDIDIVGAAPLESASPNEISFVGNRKAAAQAERSQAGCLLVTNEFPRGRTVIRVADPRGGFATVIGLLYPPPVVIPGIHPTAVIAPGAQIALTAALLVAATLEIRSIRNQLKLDYGYDENAVYAARMALMEGAYPSEDARQGFFKRAVRSLRVNPQFAFASMSSRFRMTFDGQGQYEVDGQNYLTDRDRPRGNFESVSDNYFSTLGLKILEGRDFTIDDADSKQPVAIVNASFARKYYGHESPLGRRIRIYNPGQPQEWRTIVGVVPDTLMQGPFDQQTETAGFYMPLLGATPATQFCTIIVRPRHGQRADTLGPALSKSVAQLDSNLPIYFTGTPARLHNEILGGSRIIATLFGIFGAVAFILSAVGLYGVMSLSVNQRTQEFGIRMALGADAQRIFRMVMTQGAWQLVIGLVLGAGGAALLLGVLAAAALKNILFKVNALDPTIYFAVAGLLTLVAAVSCFVPARRATRVDPMVALRYE